MINFIIKYSGGLIRDRRSAKKFLIGLVVFVNILTLAINLDAHTSVRIEGVDKTYAGLADVFDNNECERVLEC